MRYAMQEIYSIWYLIDTENDNKKVFADLDKKKVERYMRSLNGQDDNGMFTDNDKTKQVLKDG